MSRTLLFAALLACASCQRAPDLDRVAEAFDADALCLSPAPGDLPASKELRAEQQQAQDLGADAMRWVAVGRAWVRIARQSLDAGHYVHVDACVASALKRDAKLLSALELRSLVQLNQHRFEEARALSKQILDTDAERVLAVGSLSDAALELGDYPAAIAAAQRQMALAPGMAAHTRGAWLRWLRGDVEGAKHLLREALVDRDTRDPEPAAWAFTEVASIYWHAGDAEGAARFYLEALTWQSEYPPAMLGLARVALANGKPEEAVTSLQRALGLSPGVEIAASLGDAHAIAGDDAAAEKSYLVAEQLGRRGDALGLAAFLSARNRQVERALPLIEAERRHRGGIYLDDTYAWVLYRLGRHAEARVASDRARALGTRDARLLYHAGAIRLALGEREAGRALIEEALALNPHFDLLAAEEARQLLRADAPLVVATTP